MDEFDYYDETLDRTKPEVQERINSVFDLLLLEDCTDGDSEPDGQQFVEKEDFGKKLAEEWCQHGDFMVEVEHRGLACGPVSMTVYFGFFGHENGAAGLP